MDGHIQLRLQVIKKANIDAGEVFTWGLGDFGALGHGDTLTRHAPVKIKSKGKVILVSCGKQHSVFLYSRLYIKSIGNGFMYTCGNGDAGQLGTGRKERELSPQQITTVPEPIIGIAAGIFHTCGVTSSGGVWSTGDNSLGQLGLGHKKSTSIFTQITSLSYTPIEKVACGHHTAAITRTGDLYVWGTGSFGEFLTPKKFGTFNERLVNASIGGSFGTVLGESGKLWVWGANTSAELGTGDCEPRSIPVLIEKLSSRPVLDVSCGGRYALALGITSGSHKSTTDIAASRNRNRASSKLNNVLTRSTDSVNLVKDKSLCGRSNTSFAEDHKKLGQRSQLEIRQPLPQDKQFFSEIISPLFSQCESNQQLLESLNKQRDYLESALDKERQERKSLEAEMYKYRVESNNIKTCYERLQLQMEQEKADHKNELIANKKACEELKIKLNETGKENITLKKALEQSEVAMAELSKEKEKIKKKYFHAKTMLKAHIETEDKLTKENESIIQKLRDSNYKSFDNDTFGLNAKELDSYKENYERKVKEIQETMEKLKEENAMLKGKVERSFTPLDSPIDKSKKRIEELVLENNSLKEKYEELISVKKALEVKMEELEAELVEVRAKLMQSEEIKEQLEERNTKLIKALNQDINSRAKKYKINLKENNEQRNSKVQFSFGNNSSRKDSPLKKLIIKEELNEAREPKPSLQVIEYDISDECKANKSGIAAKLQDFEQKLRRSLSKGSKAL